MVGRLKFFDEEKAIQQATSLFWQQGYEGTNLQGLLQTMGIQKGSFYHTFNNNYCVFSTQV